MDERTARLALSLVPGIGSGRLHAILEAYDLSAITAWRNRRSWPEKPGVPPRIASAAFTVTPERIDRERRRLDRLNARILTKNDVDYPVGLLSGAGPVPVLFVRGQIPSHYRGCVAMVGTRRPSSSGERTSYEMASQLAAVGMTVVSGLALGIDGAAHRGALKTSGVTVAVLGCGLDVAYPRSHGDLMEQIAETGAVVTEYTLGTKPLPRHFPARNRIIAGLSAGVVLVESGRTGGALHTVDYALTANREVLAVPGDVHRWQSEGPNELLKEGAVLVRHAADVLHALGYTSVTELLANRPVAATMEGEGDDGTKSEAENVRSLVVTSLSRDGAQTPDDLQARLGLSVDTLAGALTWLEVSGRIVRRPGGRFDVPR